MTGLTLRGRRGAHTASLTRGPALATMAACLALAACNASTSSNPIAPTVNIEFSLAGRVSSDSSGLPSSRVEIVSGLNAGRTTTTDGDGRYTFPQLTAGQLVVRASAEGYEPQSSNVMLDADKTANFTLPRAAAASRVTVSGVVLDGSSDSPIASARVTAATGGETRPSATTDQQGRYTLELVSQDEVAIEATAEGYAAQTIVVRLAETRTADFRLAKGDAGPVSRVSLSGVVTAAATAGPAVPIASARVLVTAGPQAGQSAVTDEQGRYRLDGLSAGPITLEVSAAGYVAETRNLTAAADQPVNFELARASGAVSVRGRAVDALTGAGLAGISVRGDGLTGGVTDAQGAFVLTAESGASATRRVEAAGPAVVTRQTWLQMPDQELVLSLIPREFDQRAFDEMLRAPILRRWVSPPPLVIEQRAVEFTDVNMTEAIASAATMSEAATQALVADFTWALPQLTGGAFSSFARVTPQMAEAGARVNLLNAGVITVVRVVGLAEATFAWGWSRWLYGTNGVVVGGLIMLDDEFERGESPYLRSLHAHELGHALGYAHVLSTPSVMNPEGRREPTTFDLDATRIAFARPPGNRAPDADPEPTQTPQRAVGPTWSAAVR